MATSTKKYVRFGGPKLPPGTFTFYDKRNPSGTYGGEVRANPGDVVEASLIGGEVSLPDGSKQTFYGPDHFIGRGIAEWCDGPEEAKK